MHSVAQLKKKKIQKKTLPKSLSRHDSATTYVQFSSVMYQFMHNCAT